MQLLHACQFQSVIASISTSLALVAGDNAMLAVTRADKRKLRDAAMSHSPDLVGGNVALRQMRVHPKGTYVIFLLAGHCLL